MGWILEHMRSRVFDKKKDRIWREKNVIAMKDKKYIFSVGDECI